MRNLRETQKKKRLRLEEENQYREKWYWKRTHYILAATITSCK
jgi:hypothetical protein